LIFRPGITEMIVDEFRESIRPAIPQIIALLSDSDEDVRMAGANALSNLSEQGSISNFVI